jgi:hypothetical protein
MLRCAFRALEARQRRDARVSKVRLHAASQTLRNAEQWPERVADTWRIGWCATAKLLVDGPAELTGAGS